jgi:hypothetical protein
MISPNFKQTDWSNCSICAADKIGEEVLHMSFCPIGKKIRKRQRKEREQQMRELRLRRMAEANV